MDHIDHALAAINRRMSSLPAPMQPMAAPPSLASLIDRIDSAKRLYEPRALSR